MEKVLALLENIGSYLLLIRISDVLDIAIIAFLVYSLLRMVKSTRAENILKGVVAFLLVLGLADVLQLNAISYIMKNLVQVGILAIIVLFQPEIRQILEKVGSRNIKLLKNIFFVKAPMHDGAVIIRHGRILGAGCMLPLSKNVNLSRDLGMRHRAGIGMSENSDAVVVIVSEETGSISVAIGGMLKRHLMPETLGKLLRNELMPPEEETEDKPRRTLAEILGLNRKGDKDDVGMDV